MGQQPPRLPSLPLIRKCGVLYQSEGGELASHPERIIEIPGRDDEGGLTLIARFVVKLLAREV